MSEPISRSEALFNIKEQREQLREELAQLLVPAESLPNFGLLIVDIRNFRRINTVYGYEFGDQVLMAVADRLRRLLAPREIKVYRIGNDEFALILPSMLHSELLAIAANKVVTLMQPPFLIDNRHLKISVTIGNVASDQALTASPDQLLAIAERALAQARAEGLAFVTNPAIFSLSDASDLAFEHALEEALTTHSLQVHYQPKIDLFSRQARDFEALIRWQHPKYGMVAPDQFLPIVERIGRFEELTKFVLHNALRHRNDWPVDGARVAINIPASMVHERALFDMVQSAINIWGTPPAMLTLEITEGAIIKDHIASQHHLAKLKSMGIRISIDDFGTGYSSLAYFKKLPASELKIDKSFVANLCNDVDDRHLVQLIIDLAHHFGLKVVAEGVETQDTIKTLTQLNCDSVQGFYFATAMPHETLSDWLTKYDAKRYFGND